MIRFLQKPGPLKKIVLGGILVVVCVMMSHPRSRRHSATISAAA